MILLECAMNGVQMEILDNNCILCLVPSLVCRIVLGSVGQVAALPEQEIEIFHPVP